MAQQNADGSSKMLRIKTERLHLVAIDQTLAAKQHEDLDGFFEALEAQREAAWPPAPFADPKILADQLAQSDEAPGWRHWVCLLSLCPGMPYRAVGLAGFQGPPDGAGTLTLIYAFLPSFREQGLATETVSGLLNWAFSYPEVHRVCAYTEPHLTAAVRVLEKTGFSAVGRVTGPKGKTLICYEHQRVVQAA